MPTAVCFEHLRAEGDSVEAPCIFRDSFERILHVAGRATTGLVGRPEEVAECREGTREFGVETLGEELSGKRGVGLRVAIGYVGCASERHNHSRSRGLQRVHRRLRANGGVDEQGRSDAQAAHAVSGRIRVEVGCEDNHATAWPRSQFGDGASGKRHRRTTDELRLVEVVFEGLETGANCTDVFAEGRQYIPIIE